MLLGHVVLSVGGVWRLRQRVELEAAAVFERLHRGLVASRAPQAVITLAAEAAADEREHASLCQTIVERHEPSAALLTPNLRITLGPTTLEPKKRVLYEAVAMSCVTETFSVALLAELKTVADDATVCSVVHQIMTDEVAHSRLGWGYLAHEADRSDVGWLAEFLPGMIRDALGDELRAADDGAHTPDVSRFGILPRSRVREICDQALREVIFPGFEHFGISTAA